MIHALVTLALALPIPGVPFEKAAQDFLASHGLAGKAPGEVDYEKVLGEHFVAAHVGLFDVRFPVVDLEKRPGDLHKCALALANAQECWLDWLKPNGTDQKGVRDDLKLVTNWIKGWKEASISKLKAAGGKDCLELLSAPEPVAAAQKRLAEALGLGKLTGPPRETVEEIRLVLAPSRKEFVEFVCFAGWRDEQNRGLFWNDGVQGWVSSYVASDQVVALEYTVAGAKPEDYAQGQAMNEQSSNVMEQQLVQLSVNALFDRFYGERAPAPFLHGLSMNLVIDQFGELNTRIDGDTRARRTEKREVFVAGGNSEGGELGKNSAESRFRELHGKDRFFGILRLVQKEGGDVDKQSKNRYASFALRSDKGAEPVAINAPFLGSAATPKSVSEPYQGEFAEFLRSYKCAFVYWLMAKGAGAEKASRERFAALLSRLADRNANADFEAIVAEVYDKAPLSNAACDKDCLEGRFDIALSKK